METEGGTAPEAPTEAPENGQDQFAPVMEQFEQLSDRLGKIEEGMQPAEEPYDPYDAYQPEEPYEAPQEQVPGQLTPEQQQEQAALARLTEFIEQKADERLAPLQQQHEEYVRDQLAAQLETKYPALAADDDTADRVIDAALELGARLGIPRQVATHPHFIEQAYLAGLARERAAQEEPAGENNGVSLEGAGGGPGAPEEDDLPARIVRAGGNNGYF